MALLHDEKTVSVAEDDFIRWTSLINTLKAQMEEVPLNKPVYR